MKETATSPRPCPRCISSVASIEKMVPTLEDACTILRLLARSGTGQEITTYTPSPRGPPAKATETGRTPTTSSCSTTGGARCSAAISRTCSAASAAAPAQPLPGLWAIGGHATVALSGTDGRGADAGALRHRPCARPCRTLRAFAALRGGLPMAIPLTAMMRKWRERDFERGDPRLCSGWP